MSSNKIISKYDNQNDAPRIASAAEYNIRVLSAEIYRLIKLPYKSWANQDRIRSLDKQIEYLEHMLAAYEADQKKHG